MVVKGGKRQEAALTREEAEVIATATKTARASVVAELLLRSGVLGRVSEDEGKDAEVSVGSSTVLDDTIAVVIDLRTSYFLPKWKCEPRKEAGPRLKSTLKKPKAEIVDWRPFEDEGIDVGETVFVGWVLEEEPEEPDGDPPDPEVNSVAMANLEQAEKKAVEDKPAEDETGSGTPDPRYARLFTDAKLDAMGACEPGEEATVLAGTQVAVEKEEYDKELEERLIPLDEVELARRMKKSAEAGREHSLEEISSYLGIPVDVLERTSEPVAGELVSPEYWLEWFNEMLDNWAEAKRANPDFRNAPADSTVPTKYSPKTPEASASAVWAKGLGGSRSGRLS
ncbi:hypothetical protein PC114_g26880 [Phytophthora cactorum]|nr:hypothetical protein PC114_g26880 [Phytophthora cactorum]